MHKILVLHGPNLNLLGMRQQEIYTNTSLDEINLRLNAAAAMHDTQLVCMQTNAEHEIIEQIQTAPQYGFAGIIINAGGYTHTSVAIRDALLAIAVPYIEVHLSNIYAREPFRSVSYLSDKAAGVIVGLGPIGYILALNAMIDLLDSKLQTTANNINKNNIMST